MAKANGSQPGMVIGYARVSTGEQSLDGQVAALEKYGCNYIFKEIASGRRMKRKMLSDALKCVSRDDTFVVYKLDRLARTHDGLVETIRLLESRGVNFVSLTDSINTDTASGKLMLNVLAGLAQFESDIISERTKLGLAARKGAGAKFGPPHSIAGNKKRRARFLELRDDLDVLDDMTAQEIVDELNRADPKAPPITSPQTYRNWKQKGFPGVPPPEEDPLDLDDEGK